MCCMNLKFLIFKLFLFLFLFNDYHDSAANLFFKEGSDESTYLEIKVTC